LTNRSSPGYTLGMELGLETRLEMHPIGRWCFPLMVAVALLLPTQAFASMGCGSHAMARAAAAPAGEVARSWESAPLAGDQCPHCLPRHCAAAPACGASLVSFVAPSLRSDLPAPQVLGIPVRDRDVPPGLDTPPPTPPPQISV